MAKNKGIGQKIILVRRENKRPAGVTENFDQEKVEILGAIARLLKNPKPSKKKSYLVKPIAVNCKISLSRRSQDKISKHGSNIFLSPKKKLKKLFFTVKNGVADDRR